MCPEIVSRFGQRLTIWLGRMDINFNLEIFLRRFRRWENRVTFYPKRVTILPSIGLENFSSSDCFSENIFVFLSFLKAIK